MKSYLPFLLVTLFGFSFQGCSVFESTEDKQINTCVNDVKLGLDDPNSLEIVSTKGIDMKNGWYRLELNFTAKNAYGGRVRGDTICGFNSKDDIKLNPKDFMNEQRELARKMKALGL